MLATTQAQPVVNRVAPVIMGRKDYLSVLARLIRMDLYKVWRRLMSRVLLLVGALVMVVVFVLIGIAGWYTASKPASNFVPLNCAVRQVDGCINHPATQADMQHSKQLQVERYADLLNMPGVWNMSRQLLIDVLVVLGIILAGALVGGEYSLGTVRLMFTRGPTRWQFLLAKIVVLLIYVVPVILLLTALATVVGAIMSPFVGIGANLGFLNAAWIGHFVLFLLIGMLSWFAYMLMALFFGTAGRSTVAGIVGPLVWLSIEPLLSRIIDLLTSDGSGGLTDFIRAIPDYFLGNNLSSLLQDQSHALAFAAAAPYSVAHSLLVIVAYLAVFVGAAFWLTVSRDVTH